MTVLRSWSRPTPCPVCRRTNRAGARFCTACGTALTQAAQPPPPGNARRMLLNRRLKRAGIGCGGLVVLLVVVIVVVAVFGSDTRDSEGADQVRVVNPEASPTPERAEATPTPVSMDTPIPVLTATPTPAPTATPTPVLTVTPTPAPTATPPPSPIRMELARLLDEYDQNKVRADTRLRYRENGKVPVSTSGYVYEVEELYVVISPELEEYSSQNLYCYYADVRVALDVTKGQRVSVTGRVTGTGPFSSRINMIACEFEGMHYDRNPTVQAQELRRNVVEVVCTSASFFSSEYRGTGIITEAQEGTVLTVHHLVEEDNECEKIEVKASGIGDRMPATVVRHCASIDRARLRVAPEALASLSLQPIFRAAAPAQPDQEIYFWGYGTGELRIESGIVRREVWGENIETDAYAVAGDSGSPVFNEYGHLLGIMSRSNRSDIAVFTGNEC